MARTPVGGLQLCRGPADDQASDQFIPGWPYSFVAARESGRTSWCQLLDAVRLGPEDDVAEVTATQVRPVVTDLIEMGRWHFGDRDILIVFDAGYDAPRMAHLLGGVEVLGRIRSDRVMRRPTPSRRGWIVAFLLVVLTFGAGLASRRRRIPRLLTGLGTISYSVYLLTVLLHLNLLTYRYIESPSQTWGRRLAHREVLPARRGGAAPEIDRSSGLG